MQNDIIKRFKKLQESEDELNETNMNEIDELINEENNSKRYESEDELDQDIYVDILPTKQQIEEQINDDIKTTEEIMAEAEKYIRDDYKKPTQIKNFTKQQHVKKIMNFLDTYKNAENLVFLPIPKKSDGWKGPRLDGWQNFTKTPETYQFKNTDNIGLQTGKNSKILVLDIDFKKDKDTQIKKDKNGKDIVIEPFCGMTMWRALQIKYPELNDIETPIQKTGSGGLHYIFEYDERFDTCKKTKNGATACIKYKNKKVKFDIKSNCGQIIIEPSVNYDLMTEYKFENSFEDNYDSINNKLILARMPDILFEIICAGGLNDKLEPQYPEVKKDIRVITFNSENTKEINILLIAMIRDLLNIISERYYNNYDSWRNIGFAIMQSIQDEKEALKLFAEFSKLKNPAKYTGEADCYKIIEGANRITGDDLLTYNYLILLATYSDKKETNKILQKYDTNNLLMAAEGRFDVDDLYYLADFEKQYHGCRIGTNEALGEINVNTIIKDLRRCVAHIASLPEKIYVRNDEDDNYASDKFKDFYSSTYFNIRTNPEEDDKEDDDETKQPPKYTEIDLKRFIKVHKKELGMYRKVSFIPYTDYNIVKKEGVFNKWVPFQFRRVSDDKYDESKIQGLLDFIKTVWCNNDNNTYRAVLTWCYLALYRPHIKIGVCLLAYSPEQGTGKNTLTEFLMTYVFGMHASIQFPGLGNLLQRFNDFLEDRTLVVINETASENPKTDFNKLKDYITEFTGFLEGKNQKHRFVKLYTNYIMTSNNLTGVRFEDYNDRRFLCLLINALYANNKAYFTDFREKYFNNESGNLFAEYLYRHYDEYQIDIFTVLDNDLKRKITHVCKPTHILFLEEIYEEYIDKINNKNTENIEDEFNDEINNEVNPLIGAMDFFKKYQNWCINNGYSIPANNTSFGTNISNMITKYKKSGKFYYDLSTIKTPNMKITKKEN